MTFRELTIDEFNSFANNHPLASFYQTMNYGILSAEHGYDYDLVGLLDENGIIQAASLILIKPIGIKCFYGYAPRGFLIDYNDEELLSIWTQKLKEYYYEKNTIFIKINPNVVIGELVNNEIVYNSNSVIKDMLPKYDYKKLRDNLYFEASLPRYNAIIDLREYEDKKLSKNTKNKIRKGSRKGLVFKRYSNEYLRDFYDLVKNKISRETFFYKDLWTVFEKTNSVDLFLVTVDYYSFLQNSQNAYDKEVEKNTKLNYLLANYYSNKLINAKMHSDLTVLSYKNDILEATKGMQEGKDVILAGALVIKHNDTATILYSGYNENYRRFAPNYYLHYNIINYYKNDYKFLNLNGVVGDFNNENKYSGLNRFKRGFNSKIYEYLGEYDLIIEPKSYDILLSNGILAKEFDKKKKDSN